MRYFELLNNQHAIASILVALIVVFLFAVGLAFMPLVKSKSKDSASESHIFNEDISEGRGPFPMIMALIIAGTVLWAFFYVIWHSISEVKI